MRDAMTSTLIDKIMEAEKNGLSGLQKLIYIRKTVEAKYGGFWSGSGYKTGFSAVVPTREHYGSFTYNGYVWIIFRNNNETSSGTTPITNNSTGFEYDTKSEMTYDTSFSEPNTPTVKWDPKTTYPHAMKSMLIDYIGEAEKNGKSRIDKPLYIRQKMETKYGGSWSGSGFMNGFAAAMAKKNHYGSFDYNGYKWVLFRNYNNGN